MKGRRTWPAVVLLVLFACAPPVATPPNPNITPLTTPSPSTTPTTAMAASYPAFHVGEVGVAYTAVMPTASGGLQPYKWTVSGGQLPPGLNVGNDGSVSGTPTASGTFAFSITAADSGDSSVPISGQIGIAAALTASLIPACSTQCNVELGCANVCGAFGTQTGGIGPFTYQLTQGPLPAGTSLSALSLVGTFTGLTGYLQFTVQVTDSLGASDSVSPTFWMYPHIAFAGGRCYQIGFQCTVTLPYSGGIAGTTPTLKVGPFVPGQNANGAPYPTPDKFTSSVSNGNVTITIDSFNGTQGTFTLMLLERDPCGPSSPCGAGPVQLTVYLAGG